LDRTAHARPWSAPNPSPACARDRVARFISFANPALVNGSAGVLFGTIDAPISVLGFAVVNGRASQRWT
jgi:hypothetical protein